MRFGSLAKAIAPPVFLHCWRELRRYSTCSQSREPLRELPEWEFVADGWNAPSRVGGWNQVGVGDTYARKWQQFGRGIGDGAAVAVNHEATSLNNECLTSHNHYMSLAYVVARVAHKRDQLKFLDFGGALCQNQVVLATLLPDLTVDYTCCEVPEVCAQGKKLNSYVRFVDDDSWTSEKFDVVVASNSLQYIRDWRSRLAQLAAVAQSSIWVTRLPVARNVPAFVVLQRAWAHGYGTEYLGWCFNEREFLDTAKENGLTLRREFAVFPKDPVVPGAPENPHYKGYLFDKR